MHQPQAPAPSALRCPAGGPAADEAPSGRSARRSSAQAATAGHHAAAGAPQSPTPPIPPPAIVLRASRAWTALFIVSHLNLPTATACRQQGTPTERNWLSIFSSRHARQAAASHPSSRPSQLGSKKPRRHLSSCQLRLFYSRLIAPWL